MKELITFLLGMAPISEVRGAIPFGLTAGLPLNKTLFLAALGSTAVVIPLLLLLDVVSKWLSANTKMFKAFFKWLFVKTRRHSKLIDRWETFGLVVIASIPLPMFGVWTGCAAAFVFRIRFWRAFWALFCGNLIAITLVTLVFYGTVHVGTWAKIILK